MQVQEERRRRCRNFASFARFAGLPFSAPGWHAIYLTAHHVAEFVEIRPGQRPNSWKFGLGKARIGENSAWPKPEFVEIRPGQSPNSHEFGYMVRCQLT
jgi:hypothetical protein